MILAKDITKDGNPVLRRKSHPIKFPLNQQQQKLAHDLMQYLVIGQDPVQAKKYNIMGGVGIAAPQVGLNEMMVAVLVPDKMHPQATKPALKAVMVNPVITSRSKQDCALITGEGCLSVDRDIPGLVHRSKKVTINYQDVHGKHHLLHLVGYPAIVCQHEIDHLHGHLFYDHINQADRYAEIPHEMVLDFAKNTDKEFGSKDHDASTDSYRAVRIRSYIKNEAKTKQNVLKDNH
ncbi:peptide deformylase (plasmid) [uncultured bacterium]|uniref:Peptide deformylase n=1 Tax=Acetilactobacillus jinshanensis TaxID=1720083 RepID=A0A4P6ZKF1_9LACO|nr:peptide deformylase [Acetilactobacillus jinshanensis]URL61965.1 peptide deformylase [uncultured bacterium]